MKCRRCDQPNDPGRTRCTWCESRLGRRRGGLMFAVAAAAAVAALLLIMGCAVRSNDQFITSSGASVGTGITCRTDPAGWVLFVKNGRTPDSPWIHVRSVTYCYYPDSSGYPPLFATAVLYVTWNGQSHVWTKDSPADTYIIVRRTPPPPSPDPRSASASPRTSHRP